MRLKKMFTAIKLKWLKSKEAWSNYLGWWLLAICVDFGFWTVNTAAHDLLTLQDDRAHVSGPSTRRQCNTLSEAAVLIPNDIPCLISTVVLPFLPLRINVRVALIVLFSTSSFALIGANISWGLTVTGIALASLYSGTGLSSFLRYIVAFKNNDVISLKALIFAWSSGIGASGFFASLVYVVSTENGVAISTVVYSMLVVPVVMVFAFWFLLSKPIKIQTVSKDLEEAVAVKTKSELELSLKQKLKVFYEVSFSYAIPFSLSFVFQYVINQGALELMDFRTDFINLTSSVRWLMFDYLFSNMIFKSSGNFIVTDRLWLLAWLQCLNMILIVTEAMYGWMGRGTLSFWITVVLVFWEGAIAGIIYVNTFRRINTERPIADREFSLSMAALGEPLGILSAALALNQLHSAICRMPLV